MTDVAHELAGQVLDRGEDPAGNHIALDLGEPVFDLVEPGGVGRRVVEMDSGMSHKELLHPLGLVGREIVGNEMNLRAARLVGDHLGEEGNELLTGVPRGGFAHHLAAVRVKRGGQRKSAVTVVFKPVALEPPRRQWQHRVEPVQGLDGGLFVDAKHRRMLGRFDVKPNNIGGLSLKVGVVGGHVACAAMRPKPGALPHPRDHHVANPQVVSQPAGAPVRGPTCGGLRVHSRILASSAGVRFSTARPGWCEYKPANRSASKLTLPATDIVGVFAAEDLANREVRFPWRQQQDQSRAAYILGWQRARAHPVPQFRVLTRRQAKLLIKHAS